MFHEITVDLRTIRYHCSLSQRLDAFLVLKIKEETSDSSMLKIPLLTFNKRWKE